MFDPCCLCQDRRREIKKLNTNEHKEKITVCCFEQKEYDKLSHQKDIDISGNTTSPP